MALENARLNEADIIFQTGDIAKPEFISFNKHTPFDIIVSNPPYIYPMKKTDLDIEVKDYEPEQALFYDDPKVIYNRIISYSEQNLKRNGLLYLELHEDSGQDILNLFNPGIWEASMRPDYSQKNRFIRGKFHSK